MNIRTIGAMAVLLALGLMVPAAAAQDTETIAKQEFAKLVGEDAIFFVSVRDVATLRGKLDAAGLKDLLEHEQVKAFFDYVKERAEQGAGDEQNPLKDLSFSDLLDAAEGEVAFAIGDLDLKEMVENEGPDGVPDDIYFLVNAKSKAAKFQELVDSITEAIVEQGARTSEESYKGTTIKSYTNDKDEDERFAVARIGSVFALAPTPEGIKTLIRRSGEDGDGSLAENDQFIEVQAKVGSKSDILLYVNLSPITEALELAAEKGVEDNPMDLGEVIGDVFEGLGLDSLKAYGAGITVHSDRIEFKQTLYAPRGLKGLLEGIFPEASTPRIPDYVPENAHFFYTTQFDFGEIFTAFTDSILAPIAETMGQDPEMIIEMGEAWLGIDIEDDLFGNMSGQVTFSSRYEGTDSKAVIAFGVKDGDKFEEAFTSILDGLAQQMPNVDVEEEEYLDSTVFVFGEEGGAMAVKGDTIFVGPKDSVKEAMRLIGKGESTLADNEAFRQLKKLLPERYQSVGYFSADGVTKFLADLKSGELLENLPDAPGPLPDPDRIGEEFDFSKLPDAKILTENLAGVLIYSARDDEGVTWVTVAKLKGR